MRRATIAIAAAAVLTATASCTRRDDTPPPAPQPILKRESVTLTMPPACKWDLEVFKPHGSEFPSTLARTLLEKQGIGIAGLPDGSAVAVTCEGHKGSGWVDRDGELQTFVSLEKAWFTERSGADWKPASGQLEIVTKNIVVDGANVEGTYVRLLGATPREHSRRLFERLGVGIAGYESAVLVTSKDGGRRKGRLAAHGALSMTGEAWKD